MNRASAGLAVIAGLTVLMATFCGVCFVAGAAYLGLAVYISPWLAALIVGLVLLLPLLTAAVWLLWSAHQRRVRRQKGLDGLKAALASRAKADPYGFVGSAFMSGMMFAASPVTKERIAECMAACRGSNAHIAD